MVNRDGTRQYTLCVYGICHRTTGPTLCGRTRSLLRSFPFQLAPSDGTVIVVHDDRLFAPAEKVVVYIFSNYDIKSQLFPPKFSIKKQARKNQSFLWVISIVSIVVALAGFFIRMGNCMNSEICGKHMI